MRRLTLGPTILTATLLYLVASASASDLIHLDPKVHEQDDVTLTNALRVEESRSATPSTLYPYVEATEIQDSVATVGQDTLVIEVHVVNPGSTYIEGAEVTAEIREPGSGYGDVLETATVNLDPGTTTIVPMEWVPTANLDGLQVDIWADVRVPYAKADLECENLITNGTFDGGCGGWTLEGDNPPSYGIKCNFGYMDVYSTIYNTVPNRYARAYQVVLFDDAASIEDWTLRYRARYSTETGFYGVGVAQTFVYFLHDNGDGTASTIGGYVQFASTASAPPDEPSWIYDRVQEGVWFSYQLDLGTLVAGLTLNQSVDGVAVGAMAYPACSLSNCNPSANAFLDDVALVTCDVASTTFRGAAVVTSLDSGIIGDREAILRDCFSGDPGDENALVGLIPLSSALTMWEDMVGNACAAGVYQDDGDDVAAAISIAFAAKAYFDPFIELSGGLGVNSFGQLPTQYLSSTMISGVVGEVFGRAQSALAGYIDGPAKVVDLDSRALSLERALEERPSGWNMVSMVDGPATVSANALGATTTADVYRHAGLSIYEMPDSLRQMVDVGDSIRAVADSIWHDADVLTEVGALSTTTGEIRLRVLTNGATGSRVWGYPPINVVAGDYISWSAPDGSGRVDINVDLGNDGTIDEVLQGVEIGATGTPDTPSVGRKPLSSIAVFPNPFNPRTTIHLKGRAGAQVRVWIADSRGRRVRSLYAGRMASSQFEVTWDGTDARGEEVSSGVYFIYAYGEGTSIQKKIALIR